MSAFIVDETTIETIVTAAYVMGHIPASDMQSTARMLMRENARSVNYRYPNHKPATVPRGYKFRQMECDTQTHYGASQVLECIRTLDYQSCETENYPETKACRFLNRLAIELRQVHAIS